MTIAHNTSSNSIYLSWKPPAADTIFGEFLGYRITYWARDVKPENVNEILIRESSVEVSKQWIVNEIKWRTFAVLEVKSLPSVFPFIAQSYKSRIQFPQFDGKCPRERVKMFWFPFCDSTKPRIEVKSIQFISVKATDDFLGRKSNCMFRRLLPFNIIAFSTPSSQPFLCAEKCPRESGWQRFKCNFEWQPRKCFYFSVHSALFSSLKALSTLLRLKAFNYHVGLCSCLSKQ